MKVLYFTTLDLTLPKGPSINEREFLGELLRHPSIEARAVLPRSAIRLGELPTEKIHKIQHAWGASVLNIIASELEVGNAIRRELVEFKPDIVVGRLALLPFGSYRVLRHWNIPFAIKTLGGAGFAPSGWRSTQIITRCFRPITRRVLRRAVKMACVIDSATNELRSLHIREVGACPDSIFVVPNSTNTNRFTTRVSSGKKESLGIPESGIVIGYTGGDPVRRGGREVVQLVARLRSEGIDAYGLVVGGAAPILQKLAQRHKITEKFHALGRVDYAEMPKWINLIDIGIAFDNSERAAKVGNSYQKVRQFVACGRFIISSQIDDTDPVTQCPLVVRLSQKDNEAIFLATRHILELSREERKRRQIAGRIFAEQHLSLEASLETRIKLWKSFVDRKSTDETHCDYCDN